MRFAIHAVTILVVAISLAAPLATARDGAAKGATFTNPLISSRDSADPWIVHHDGFYYYTATLDPSGGIWVWKTRRLADLDNVWLRAYVNETDLGRIRWGQGATLKTDTYPDKTYRGRISFIASQAEFTPKSVQTFKERVTLVYRIKIDLENPNHELKPGMPADATIDLKGK